MLKAPKITASIVPLFSTEERGIRGGESLKGISPDKMDAGLLQKIEELTLYMIELKEENKKLTDWINKLENEN